MQSITKSEIVWPRAANSGCIFCTIVRDTRGVTLGQADRFNFFPASPLCCVSWVLAGDLLLVDRPELLEAPCTGAHLPQLFFSGPQPGPIASWSPGELFTVTMGFYPDAFAAMTGLDLTAFTGRLVPAHEVLPPLLLQPCQAFLDGARQQDTASALAALEHEIAEIWSRSRPAGSLPARCLRDWTRNLVSRAALSATGRSTRQIARRVKAWTGLSERELKSLGHTELLYNNIHEALHEGDIDWATLASDSGFADQAHMIRRMRKHTGFTPQQLRERASSHEAFWAYRLLGQYFSEPTS